MKSIAEAVGGGRPRPLCDEGTGRVPRGQVERTARRGSLVGLERHGFSVIRDEYLVSAAHLSDRVTDPRHVAPDLGPHPEWPAWVVFHAPHTSTRIPPEDRDGILLDDDALGQELVKLTDHHADLLLIPEGLIRAAVTPNVSRLVVDVERFLDDDREPMAHVGMGAIYTRTSDGRPLRAAPTPEQRRRLLDAYYHPHHARLSAAVQAALDAHGHALILDLHTFPDVPLPCDVDQTPGRPDICIGTDAFHTPRELRDAVVEQLTGAGFSVVVDRPYSGAIVPQNHAHRDQRVGSIMIEVNRRLYLQPDGATTRPVFGSLGAEIRDRVRHAIVEWDRVAPRRIR
jgi:N-formylglutamate deformylase